MLGTDDYDEWVGSRICLGSAKVQFKDKIVDAIRVQPIRSANLGHQRTVDTTRAGTIQGSGTSSIERPLGDTIENACPPTRRRGGTGVRRRGETRGRSRVLSADDSHPLVLLP